MSQAKARAAATGAGRAMLEDVEAGLDQRGVEYLQVKTLSAANPDPGTH